VGGGVVADVAFARLSACHVSFPLAYL
jgi:hypothetical protein